MDAIKAQVRALSARELAELYTYIKGLMSAGGIITARVAAGDDILLAVFEDSCRKFGLGFVAVSVKQRVRNYEPSLKIFLAHACPGSAAVVHRAVLATAIDLLYDDMQINGRIVNPRSLAYGLDRLPSLLDRSFPAYAACGILAKIVRVAA
jgi:hypothetical protein